MTFGSLFSGIEGFGVGLERVGMRCVFQVEREPSCLKVLSRHWPDVPKFKDVRDFNATSIAVRPGLICGGFPCQDLSVAGRRAGLAGERSGLFFEFMRIVDEFTPRWVLIENVPGLLSGCGCPLCGSVAERMRQHLEREREANPMARDCGCGECEVGKELHQAHSGRNFSIVVSTLAKLGYGWAMRILDAQWFGVPQRRRRVFIVGCLGDFRRAAEILFERNCLPWDSPPSREAGARVAACVRGGTESGSNEQGNKIAVAHTLRAEGFDASEDGTGRGTPMIPIDMRQASRGDKMTNNRCEGSSGGAPGTGIGEDGDPCPTLADSHTPAIAFSSKDHGSDAGELAPTLRAMGHDQSHMNGGGQVAIAFQEAQTGCREYENAGTLRANGPGHDPVGTRIRAGMAVRRLTPRECERLQGFPDDWTRYDADGNEISDSARYRMCGNAVAVPVANWIGRRIMESSR